MKTLGKIFIILAVFALVTGAIFTLVNASGGTSGTPAFNGPDGNNFPQGNNPQRGGDNQGGGSVAGLILGMIGRTAVIGLITTAIVLPKSMMRIKRRESRDFAS